MSHCGIYKIENNITHNLYIGKAKNIEHRWSQHKGIAKKNKNKKHLYNSIRKYGIENFTFSIIEEIPLQDYDRIASEKEKYWIKYYNAYEDPENYNYTKGGDGVSGWIPDQDWKNNQSKLKKEWYQTDKGIEFKQYLTEKGKENGSPFQGLKHTEEWKKQHSLDMQGENNPMYKKHSNGKICKCIELNKIYFSTREAEKETNILHQYIARACRTHGLAGGYHWEYIQKEEE